MEILKLPESQGLQIVFVFITLNLFVLKTNNLRSVVSVASFFIFMVAI